MKTHMTTDELLSGLGCFTGFVGGILGILAILVLNPTVIWLLWNWVMVEVFAAPALTWIQAIGLYLLVRFLIGDGINLTVKRGEQ